MASLVVPGLGQVMAGKIILGCSFTLLMSFIYLGFASVGAFSSFTGFVATYAIIIAVWGFAVIEPFLKIKSNDHFKNYKWQ